MAPHSSRRLVTIAATAVLGLGVTPVASAHAAGPAPGSAARGAVPGAAAAAVPTADEPPRPAFYEAPATLPAGNGTVIRSEPLTFAIDPLRLSSLSVKSTRILYTSTDRRGRRVAVSGTVLMPRAPWLGVSKRPIIGYAVGTQGLADRCAPSRQQSEGLEYETPFVQGLLNRGYAIAMTDYQGLGTEGVHTYLDRKAQGQAVLDAVRAAQRLTGSGLDATHPVGVSGYSQGGAAAAAAAELASTYAPELRIKGVIAGAVPADPVAVARNLDGGMYAEYLYYAVRGLAASYDLEPTGLNERGQQVFEAVESHCVTNQGEHAGLKSSTLTEDGRSLIEWFAEEPYATAADEQILGRVKPSMPVYVTHSALDDVIPYQVGRNLAKRWCAKGANVYFSSNITPTHIGGSVPNTTEQYAFFEGRFAGLPQLSNCWRL